MGRGKKVDTVMAKPLSEVARRVREQFEQYGRSTEFLGLVDAFASDDSLVDGLVELVASDDRHPFPQYASHILLHIGRSFPETLDKHYESLIDTILSTTNTSVQRNVLGALLCFPLQPYKEGELLEWLFVRLNHPDSKPGILNYSVRKLAQYAVNYPELAQEIRLALELREELSGRTGWVEWGTWVMKEKRPKKNRAF